MTFFGPDLRNGLPIGLGSVAGFGIAPRFSPASLFTGGVQGAWYDPSDPTTLFSDRAGTTPCGTPGGGSVVPVGRMLDKSGNGNHATAANDTTARPELRARVNLLTRSEEFSNAVWITAFVTVTANTVAAPDGSLTADTLASADGYIYQEVAGLTANAVYTGSIYLYAPVAINGLFIRFTNTSFVVLGSGAYVNVTTGWNRFTFTDNIGANTTIRFVIGGAGTFPNGTSMYSWGAQLTATNEFPANTYQRIVDANTYDAVGFPRYLVANGTSSAMSTPGNVNLSGTDKVTVFAGVRKLSDAAFGMVAEFGNNAPAGSFWVLNGDGAVGPGPQWQFLSIGATTRAYATATATSPISNVFTGIGDINAPLSRLRLNGAQVANTTTTQGGGNYGTYPLFIGARNNASLFFNGNIYSLIVVGSAVSAGQISATEQWVAGKTGITI